MKKLIVIVLLTLTLSTAGQDTSTLMKFVRDWIGTPYRFGGTSKITGIDCSAFVQRLYKDVYGAVIPRTCKYQYDNTIRVSKDSILIGDLVFFNSKVSPSGWHVGIYIGDGEFIHSANWREGVKISCLLDPAYSRIYKGAGRPKPLQTETNEKKNVL